MAAMSVNEIWFEDVRGADPKSHSAMKTKIGLCEVSARGTSAPILRGIGGAKRETRAPQAHRGE